MTVRTTNTELMSFVVEREDISVVEDPKTKTNQNVQVHYNTKIIRLPVDIGTYIMQTFPGDAGSPMVALSARLYENLPVPPRGHGGGRHVSPRNNKVGETPLFALSPLTPTWPV